jgi:hypothetical protein
MNMSTSLILGLSLRDVFGPFGYKWTIATREELGPISGDLRFTQLNATVADNGGCEPPQSPTLTKPAVFRGSLPVPVCPQRLIGGLPLDAFDTSSRQEDSRKTKLSRVSRTCASWCVKADRELKMARAEHSIAEETRRNQNDTIDSCTGRCHAEGPIVGR